LRNSGGLAAAEYCIIVHIARSIAGAFAGGPWSICFAAWSAQRLPDLSFLLACLANTSDRPEHGTIGTASLREVEGLQSSRRRAGLRLDSSSSERPLSGQVVPSTQSPIREDCDTTRQGDHGTLTFAAFGKLSSPTSKPCRSVIVYNDGCRLAQRSPEVHVTGSRDAARDIPFAELAARWRQTDPRPDHIRRREAGGVIKCRPEGQHHYLSDPRHRHQSTENRIILGQLAHLLFENGRLLGRYGSGSQHGHFRGHQPGISVRQFSDATFELAARNRATRNRTYMVRQVRTAASLKDR